MNIFNLKMFDLILNQLKESRSINPELFDLVSDGFIMRDDAYFLLRLYNKQPHMSRKDFIDKTGHECFINSFHIDDYAENDFFIQSLFFANQVLLNWKRLKNNLTLQIIIGQTDFGFNIKFHVLRENEEWIKIDEVNNFDEALILIQSDKN
jgi:hypothetical protein